MAPDGDEHNELEPQDPRERQRQLEEVRRSFTAVGRRLGTLGQQQRFATVLPVATRPSVQDTDTSGEAGGDADDAGLPSAPAAGAPQLPTVEVPPRRRLRWPVAAVALAVIFAIGLLLGRTFDQSSPAATGATPAPSTIVETVTRTVTPPSCLAAVRYADRSIDLLVKKVRDQRLLDTLDAFTKERRTCQATGPQAAGAE